MKNDIKVEGNGQWGDEKVGDGVGESVNIFLKK